MEDIPVSAIPCVYEPFSCLTHLAAIPVFAVLSLFLVRKGSGDRWRTFSLSAMACTTLLLLSASATYHLLSPGPGRNVMRLLDVCSVFSLIAGTVTPIHAILFRGVARWFPILFVWLVAATGITLKATLADRFPPTAELASFLAMGWGGLFACVVLWTRYGYRFVLPLIFGGLAYTVGAIILAVHGPTLIPGIIGPHELWHVAVLAGLGFHWQFVFRFAGFDEPNHNSDSESL